MNTTALARRLPGRGTAWRAWALAGAAGVLGLAVLAAWTPPAGEAWSTCLFRRVTHVPCATCGMTRALSSLAHGDLAGARARHPLAVPFAAEAALLWLLAPLAIRRRWAPPERWLRAWLLAHGVLLLAVWGARLAA